MCYRRLSALFVVAAELICLASPSRAASSNSSYEVIIERSDLVVRAIVRGLSRDEVPIQEFMPEDPRPDKTLGIILVELEVIDVLKGYHNGAGLTVVVPDQIQSIRTNYNIGDEIVLSMIYWKFMRGGSFMVTNDGGRFLKVGERWEGQLVARGAPSKVIPLDELREVASRCEPKTIFRKADVAAVGRIISLTSHEEGGAVVEDVRMRVLRSVKGVGSGEEILFRATRKPGNLKWQTIVPRFAVGEEWLICLARDEQGLYVLDGTNGVFRVEGERLMQADRVELPVTRDKFVASMLEATSGE